MAANRSLQQNAVVLHVAVLVVALETSVQAEKGTERHGTHKKKRLIYTPKTFKQTHPPFQTNLSNRFFSSIKVSIFLCLL